MHKALLFAAGALTLASCEPKRIAVALPIPPERTDCEAATGKRPTLPPEYQIDWQTIATVGQAKAAHDNFVNVVRGREGLVANYVLEVEGMLAQCSIDAQWVREWNAETAR